MNHPFVSEAEFEQMKRVGMKPDALFPIMDYKICKYIWENSPLIQHLSSELDKQFPVVQQDRTSVS